MSEVAVDKIAAQPNWRIAPSVPVAFGVFIAYVAVFIGLSSSSGIPFEEWFVSGPNIVRAAVLPLAAGSTVLIVFLLWARWDFVFKDPDRLPMSPLLWIGIGIYVVSIVVQFAIADWGNVADRLLPIIAAGVLVGFAEETLFRGIILRSLRTNNRPEAWAMLIVSLWFGFFHLANLANGAPLSGVLIQCFYAFVAGVMFYLFRRSRGLLVVAMIAHGLYDMSKFLPAQKGDLTMASSLMLVLVVISALVAVIVILVRDRSFTVTRSGVEAV